MEVNTVEKIKLQTQYGVNFDNKTIYVTGELHEHIGQDLYMRFNMIDEYYKAKNEELKEITLEVCSFGGMIYSINAALDFYDRLKNRGVLVNTLTSSVCMSAATILVAGATGKRIATKRAKFMLHDLQIGGVEGTANQVAKINQQIQSEQEELFTYYVDFANKGKEFATDKEKMKEVRKWIKKYCDNNDDSYLSSQQILDLKLIDEII